MAIERQILTNRHSFMQHCPTDSLDDKNELKQEQQKRPVRFCCVAAKNHWAHTNECQPRRGHTQRTTSTVDCQIPSSVGSSLLSTPDTSNQLEQYKQMQVRCKFQWIIFMCNAPVSQASTKQRGTHDDKITKVNTVAVWRVVACPLELLHSSCTSF